MKARTALAVLAIALALIAVPVLARAAKSTDAPTGSQVYATTPSPRSSKPAKPTKTPVPTKTATATKALTPTKTPTATRTLAPTDTPTATATLRPTNTPGLTPTTSKPLLTKQNVIDYMNSIKGKQILSGQQETEWIDGLSQDLNYIKATTGKAPAIRGFESQLTTNTYKCKDPTDVSIAAWRDSGFILEWSWHMGAPIAGDDPIATDDYDHSKLTVDVNRVLTPGTTENQNFIAKLDAQAARLQKLRDNGVPVLWRPFHEMNGNWFWWSKSGPEPYKQLWLYMYDYFTNTKQLNNLIWVWSTIRGPEYGEGNAAGKYFYPGDQYVDFAGGDLYSGYSPFDWTVFTDAYNGFVNLAPGKGAAITEASVIPDPKELFETKSLSYVWFLPWYGSYVKSNPADYLTYVYNSPYTVTLDELPDLKTTSGLN